MTHFKLAWSEKKGATTLIKQWRNITTIVLSGVLGVMLLMSAVTSIAAHAQQQTRSKNHAFAQLEQTPYGEARLFWYPKTGFLKVSISLTGLAPNSTHPANIQQGDCDGAGSLLYPLNHVVADASGNATATTFIPAVAGGIPASGWFINVHNGPSLATADQFTSVSCGSVTNDSMFSMQAQTVRVNLEPTSVLARGAFGNAYLALNGSTLTVVVNLQGLSPSSRHPVYIRTGSCQNQKPGRIVASLNDVVADANGSANSTTFIMNVHNIPTRSWYISIHNTQDLSNQTGFNLISCGNVQ